MIHVSDTEEKLVDYTYPDWKTLLCSQEDRMEILNTDYDLPKTKGQVIALYRKFKRKARRNREVEVPFTGDEIKDRIDRLGMENFYGEGTAANPSIFDSSKHVNETEIFKLTTLVAKLQSRIKPFRAELAEKSSPKEILKLKNWFKTNDREDLSIAPSKGTRIAEDKEEEKIDASVQRRNQYIEEETINRMVNENGDWEFTRHDVSYVLAKLL